DMKAHVANAKFRLDLFYRLGVFTIHLPPLRERGEDLPALALQFVRRFSRELGRDVREIAPACMDRLRAYRWAGNTRELQRVLKQAVLRAHGYTLLPSFLPELSAPVELEVAGSGPEVASPAAQVHTPTPATLDVEAFLRDRLHEGSTDIYGEVRNF